MGNPNYIDIESPKFADLKETIQRMHELHVKAALTPEEATWYNKHIYTIGNFYAVNANYWKSVEKIQYGSPWVDPQV